MYACLQACVYICMHVYMHVCMYTWVLVVVLGWCLVNLHKSGHIWEEGASTEELLYEPTWKDAVFAQTD